jgi:hypothetical protein
MSELNSLVIMSFAKMYRLNLKNPKKIFFLRLFFILKFIINRIQLQKKKLSEKKEYILINSKKNSEWIFLGKISNTINKIFFHLITGTYSIGLVYYSLCKVIISLPFYMSGL